MEAWRTALRFSELLLNGSDYGHALCLAHVLLAWPGVILPLMIHPHRDLAEAATAPFSPVHAGFHHSENRVPAVWVHAGLTERWG